MKKRQVLRPADLGREGHKPLREIETERLVPLPPPYDSLTETARLTEDQESRLACNLDGFVALGLPKPENKEAEDRFIRQFLAGIKKLLSREDNWTFLQTLLLSLDYCERCQTCSDACHIYLASGRDDLYRPTISIQFGAFYLATLLEVFDHQIPVALVAYNGGPGNTRRWLDAASGDLDLFAETIPAEESRRFLRRVYEGYSIYETLYRVTGPKE